MQRRCPGSAVQRPGGSGVAVTSTRWLDGVTPSRAVPRPAGRLAVAGGPGTRMLAPGDSQRLNLGVVTQRFQFWCTVDSHKSLGMSLAVQVVPPAASRA